MVKNSIIWIIGLAIALTSGLLAMGAVAKDKAPALAVSLYPINGFAAENIASESIKTSIAENSGQFPDHVNPQGTEFALKAFIAEPITPEAIAVLAFAEADQHKRKLMNKALLLSRRESLVTAWMIADSGARDDMPALLNHYDTMLRTNTSAAPVIITLMADTLANDNFVAPFASLLTKQPPWAYQFWGTVAGKPESIVNAARLREMLYKPYESDDIYRDANLISALVRNQQFETAEALYHLLVGQTEAKSLLKNGSFEAEPNYSPMDWELFSTGEYGAIIFDGNLKLSAIQNSGGLFARQIVKLPRNSIIELSVMSTTKFPRDSRIYINLSCAESERGSPMVTKIYLNSNSVKRSLRTGDSKCDYFWIELEGRASEAGGFDLNIDTIDLKSFDE